MFASLKLYAIIKGVILLVIAKAALRVQVSAANVPRRDFKSHIPGRPRLMPAQSSRRHHFVPAFYLRKWAADDGKLCVWSRPHKKVVCYRKFPDGAGWHLDLYAFRELPEAERQYFEDTFLRHVDDLAAKALQTMLEDRTVNLEEKLRSAWSRFAIAFRYRHPDVVAELREIVRKTWDKALREGGEDYATRRSEGDCATYDEYLASLRPSDNAQAHVSLLQSVMDNERIGTRVNNMGWTIFDLSKADNKLLTSDWPLTLSMNKKPRHFFLPISPTSLFVASEEPRLIEGVQRTHANDVVLRSNASVVERARLYVFGSDDRQNRFVCNRMSRNPEVTPFFGGLKV